MKCPCKECPTMPICRNRDYHYLLNFCLPLDEYILPDDRKLHKKRVRELIKALKPKYWSIEGEDEKGYNIYRVEGWENEVTL